MSLNLKGKKLECYENVPNGSKTFPVTFKIVLNLGRKCCSAVCTTTAGRLATPLYTYYSLKIIIIFSDWVVHITGV